MLISRELGVVEDVPNDVDVHLENCFDEAVQIEELCTMEMAEQVEMQTRHLHNGVERADVGRSLQHL